jgi:hypothetical protein
MQVLPHSLPFVQVGGLGGVTWQTLPTAMQVFPHATPFVQCGAALAVLARARAATAAIMKLRMVSPRMRSTAYAAKASFGKPR